MSQDGGEKYNNALQMQYNKAYIFPTCHKEQMKKINPIDVKNTSANNSNFWISLYYFIGKYNSGTLQTLFKGGLKKIGPKTHWHEFLDAYPIQIQKLSSVQSKGLRQSMCCFLKFNISTT